MCRIFIALCDTLSSFYVSNNDSGVNWLIKCCLGTVHSDAHCYQNPSACISPSLPSLPPPSTPPSSFLEKPFVLQSFRKFCLIYTEQKSVNKLPNCSREAHKTLHATYHCDARLKYRDNMCFVFQFEIKKPINAKLKYCITEYLS